jgi:membrane fusion protein, multidrug efflux system
MTKTSPDSPNKTGALSFSTIEAKRKQGGPGSPAISSPVEKPRRKSGITRMVVVGLVAMATVIALIVGGSWSFYRYHHTVISNATVKGRVHRVGARIDGQVKAVEVQSGQRVVKDEVLFRLADDHYQAAWRQAQSELQSATKRFEAEKLAIEHDRRRLAVEVERCESVCNATAGEAEAAASTQDKWEREFNRVTSLIASGVASASEMDRARAERDNSRALVKAANGNFAAAESNCRAARVQVEGISVREAGLEVLAAEVERARQRLSASEADLDATVIRAPEDGWVADRIVEPGGSARVGEPMMTLWIGAPWIEAWADEDKLSRIRIGSSVDVTLTAFPGRKLRGRVESIGVFADKELQAAPVPTTLHSLFPKNAMVPIRIAVFADQLRLQPGLSALVGIRDAAHDKSPTNVDSKSTNSFVAALPLGSPATTK